MEKRLIAPITITVCIILFCAFFVIARFIIDDVSLVTDIIVLAVVIVFAGLSVFVLWERIKEIRSGEEDDLSKY